jgi:hypothetical protein
LFKLQVARVLCARTMHVCTCARVHVCTHVARARVQLNICCLLSVFCVLTLHDTPTVNVRRPVFSRHCSTYIRIVNESTNAQHIYGSAIGHAPCILMVNGQCTHTAQCTNHTAQITCACCHVPCCCMLHAACTCIASNTSTS